MCADATLKLVCMLFFFLKEWFRRKKLPKNVCNFRDDYDYDSLTFSTTLLKTFCASNHAWDTLIWMKHLGFFSWTSLGLRDSLVYLYMIVYNAN